jgi:hypothetical protein
MTVLGTATKVYAGGVAAVAVYAGSVKVWPTAPPGPPPSMVIVGAKFGVWLKSPVPQADLKGPQPYLVTFDLDPTWFDSSSPHPYWVDANNEAMVVRGPDGALSTREQVRDWAGGATLTWVDPGWRLDPLEAPPVEPPPSAWPPQPKAGADGVGRWRMDHPDTGGLLVLEVASVTRSTQAIIDIEPYTGTPEAAGNPFRGIMWLPYTSGAFPVTNMGMDAPVWNGYYPAQWGGHRLKFYIGTVLGQVGVTAFTNMGVSPA